jgi:hypothetical protein
LHCDSAGIEKIAPNDELFERLSASVEDGLGGPSNEQDFCLFENLLLSPNPEPTQFVHALVLPFQFLSSKSE